MKNLGNGQYEIRNKKTGETRVVFESDLSSYGLRAPTSSTSQQTTQQTQPKMGGVKGVIRKSSEILDMLGLGALPVIGGAAYEGQRAVRSAAGDQSGYYNAEKGESVENPFLSDEKMASIQKNPVKQMAKQSAGLASWGVPLSKGSLAAKAGLSGGVGALSEASQESATPESIRNSAMVGSLFPLATTAGSKVTKTLLGSPKRAIMGLFKPTQGELETLRKYAKLDFADEVIKNNDIKILNKKPEEVLKYFEKRMAEISKQKKNLLDKTNDTVAKEDLVKLFTDEIKARSKNTVGQGPAVRTLTTLKKDLLNNYRNHIDLPNVDRLKSRLQNAAKSYYSNDTPTPSSDAVATIARKIKEIIANKVEKYERINQLTMYYRVAYDSYSRVSNQAAKSPQLLERFGGPAYAGTILGGLTYMGTKSAPLTAGVLAAPLIMTEMFRRPNIKGKIAQASQKAATQKVPEWIAKLGAMGAGRTAVAISK
jgi:hypothetical protein